jgi:hypothetical protein
LGSAWAAGLHLVWRYVGLWLLLAALALLIAAVVGVFIIALVALIRGVGQPNWLLALLAILVGLPLVLTGIILAVGMSIVVTFAQRAIVVQDTGPVGALSVGVRLLRAQFTESVLVWLLSMALGIAAGLAIILVLSIALLPLGAVGVGLWHGLGLSAPTIVYLLAAAVTLLGLCLMLGAISNTFFWNYWTLAYVRLSELATQQRQA